MWFVSYLSNFFCNRLRDVQNSAGDTSQYHFSYRTSAQCFVASRTYKGLLQDVVPRCIIEFDLRKADDSTHHDLIDEVLVGLKFTE